MPKHKLPGVEPTFICEWGDCTKQDMNEDKFYEHVSHHIPELRVIPSGSGEEMYECSWKNCGHTTSCSRDIVRHVKFHGYHAILKAKGVAESVKRNLPSCNYAETENNALQPWNKPLLCQWEDCTVQYELSGFKEFLAHVKIHTNEVIYNCEPYTCGWLECKFSISKVKARLVDHVKVHTGEKHIACPVCGNMFANVTKFADHCERQTTTFPENWEFKCDICFAYLPNERILKDHTRQHIHHHKCCFCDLTCHSPAVLVEHIRYRHLPYRPYKCSSCPRECKSAYDLKQHLKTHTEDVVKYRCSDCDFKCSRQSSLMRHYKDEHDETCQYSGAYKCHLCDKKYSRGTGLTKHLQKAHKLEKPPGYSRFIYQLEEGGSYQLRQFRLECLEVMETDDESKGLPGNENAGDSNKVLAIIDTLNDKGEIIETTYPVSDFECPKELPPETKVLAVFDDHQRVESL